MAGWATPGKEAGVLVFIPSRFREWATTRAVSPIPKILGCPGIDKSGLTLTLPNLSVSTLTQRAAGEATTPAHQMIVWLGPRLPSTTTPSESTLSTRVPVQILTPSFSRWRCALDERLSGKVGNIRVAASYRII